MRSSADLAALQDGFTRALLGGGSPDAAGVAAHRFTVYRNNVFASLADVLRARYPAVERLTGEEFFAAAARLFVSEHPPSSPVLLEYGEGFPDFLAAFEPARELLYLAGVARLEWLRHAAFHAADCPALTASALSGVEPERAGELIFEPHPSTGLIGSPYPIVSIWETNVRDEQVRVIGPELPGEAALIVRPGLDVNVHRLDAGEHMFAAALLDGVTLADAARTASAGAVLSLPHAIAKLLAAGAFRHGTTRTGD
jgi:hypothetical protein